MKKSDNILKNRLQKKATTSDCTYKISGVAYSKKGNILGWMTNTHSKWNVLEKEGGIGRAGTAEHCEKRLIEKYGRKIKTIVICRVGHGGDILPISCCANCQKLADKYNITVKTISP